MRIGNAALRLPPVGQKPAEGGAASSKTRRPRRAALFIIVLALLGGLLALILPGAWQETQRREAYLPQLEAQAQRSPYDGPLLALIGGRLMEAGEYDKAADALRRAIAAGESNDALWLNLAAATAATGDRPRAVADLRLGLHSLPNSQSLQEALGRALSAGQSDPLPVVISPQGPQPLIAAYSSGSFLNKPVEWWGRHHPEASGYATRQNWAREQPGNAQAQRLWGLALLQNRRVPEAGAALAQAIRLAPRSPLTNLALADWLDQSGQASKSTLQYLSCLRLRPNWLPALLGMGRTSLESGLLSYATQAYTRATQIDLKSADAWIGLGRAQIKTGAVPEKARAAFETAARLSPVHTDFWDDYAEALRQTNRWADAEALLRRRLQAAPDDALAHYLLGQILHDSAPTPARLAEAEAQTREALRLSPRNPLAEVHLGQFLSEQGQIQAAIPLYQDALDRRPFDQKTLLLLARAYRQAGQNDLAQKTAQQARMLFQDQQRAQVLEDQRRHDPMNLQVHQQLAILDARIGESAKARREQDMARLLRSDPQRARQEIDAFDNLVSQVLQTH